MTAIIDADSLIYIIAWNNREGGSEEEIKTSCDSFLRDILALSGCDDYIGVFSDKKCFRHEVYKYATYKGNRPEPEEWLTKWKEIIIDYFIRKHGFLKTEDLEADDVVCALNVIFSERSHPVVICSPDKDLRQVPGVFFNFSKKDDQFIQRTPEAVNPDQANFNFWMQMLTGDKTDNIAGVPGLGDVKAKKLLDDAMDNMMYKSIVLGAYCKYFGSYYGNIIFTETYATVMMLTPKHPFYPAFGYKMKEYSKNIRTLKTGPSIFDITG